MVSALVEHQFTEVEQGQMVCRFKCCGGLKCFGGFIGSVTAFGNESEENPCVGIGWLVLCCGLGFLIESGTLPGIDVMSINSVEGCSSFRRFD